MSSSANPLANMSTCVLVTGATGLLGRQVFNTFKHSGCLVVGQGYSRAIPPTIQKADLEKPGAVKALLDEAKPQIVVHCAANRSPDLCDKNPEQARRVNVDATRILAEETSRRSILLIYISTDYVFPGIEGQAPYEADAETNPPNFYGQSKRDGELAVLEATKETGLGLILRVPVLYGVAKDNSESAVNCLVDAIYKAQDENAGVKMDDWAQRYPTNTEDVARVCRDIVIKYIKERRRIQELPKVLQFSSEDRMTKYEICEKLADVLGLSLVGMIRNKEGNDPNSSVQRPYDTHLSTKVLKDLGIDVRTVDFVAWWRKYLGAYRK
ncbi:dTDP-4-dehydrorhamnose reductase family protein [Aspergillus saccharolyticus JOP 1030-1]|uniref:NAD dependent epimerase/dehydratase family protein n=1 Tax=Aspergillus saccharolyticus JOP 1030-1 TaxID=1450539 RepID=A0A318ZH60_9EURO|nr:NAD dependent epimerase/dehydratase family protein [Aspergillus saccharolyticus JOP 1030-1]PYH46305.1 NAD dependent epimerase/dehydratase family protein [Aspergillus saccharolyticus JOP 1030-1]